jgi:hypothetical protein
MRRHNVMRIKVGDLIRSRTTGTLGIVKKIHAMGRNDCYHVQFCTNEFGIAHDDAELVEAGIYELEEDTGNMIRQKGKQNDQI